MTTTDLLTEYNNLDSRYQELRAELHRHCDTIKVLDEMNRNVQRRKEIAREIFGQPKTENQ